MTSRAKSEGRFDKQDFVYLSDEDVYRCPASEKLSYRYTNEEKLRRYWTNACSHCTLKDRCTTGKERRITRWEHENVVEAMHGNEKSDPNIVAVKPANKAARSATEPSVNEPAAAESAEPRAGTQGNADWHSTRRTQRRVSVLQTLERIRQVGARLLCRLYPR